MAQSSETPATPTRQPRRADPVTPTRQILSRMGIPSTNSRPNTSTSRPNTSHSVASWKTGNVRHIAQQVVQPLIKQASNLIHAYMVCGLNRDPTEWIVAPKCATGRPSRTNGAVGSFLSPQILGSIPPHEKDQETVQMFAAALKAVFPNDCEICVGSKPPGSTCHSFVLQMSPTRSLYGVALRLWVRSDKQRLARIATMIDAQELDEKNGSQSVWIPYCISYLSHYPLFDLMSDYLRCSWTLWSKQPDKFNNDGVLRLMKMAPPRPDQMLRIALDEYVLCYQVPSRSQDFQNFPLWPIFTCLTPNHVVAAMEAALSPQGKIILSSSHPAILTPVAETIRFFARTWNGLYVPIVYGRHTQDMVDEPAPYILGITKSSKPLYTAPKDALVVDLDSNRIYTTKPPASLSQRQRQRYASTIQQSIQGAGVDGVPNHLRSAYENNVRFSAFGCIMTEDAQPWAKEPEWWDHQKAIAAMHHVCDRIRRNFKLLTVFKSMTATSKIREADLAEIIHDRNNIARGLDEAWREYINVKHRSDLRTIAHRKSEAKLNADIQKQKIDFEELSECTEQLIEEARQLQGVVTQKDRDIAKIEKMMSDKITHAAQMSRHAKELQTDLDDAKKKMKKQEELLAQKSPDKLSQERDDAQRAVIHLTSLISGQVAHIERNLASLISNPASRPPSATDLRKDATRRQSLRRSPSPQMSPDPTGVRSKRMSLPRAMSYQAGSNPHRASRSLDTEPEGFDDKIKLITETVRKINNQCFAAIEDLASRRDVMSDAADQAGTTSGANARALGATENAASTVFTAGSASTAYSGVTGPYPGFGVHPSADELSPVPSLATDHGSRATTRQSNISGMSDARATPDVAANVKIKTIEEEPAEADETDSAIGLVSPTAKSFVTEKGKIDKKNGLGIVTPTTPSMVAT